MLFYIFSYHRQAKRSKPKMGYKYIKKLSNFLKQLGAVIFIKCNDNMSFVGDYFQMQIKTHLVINHYLKQ